MKGPGALGPTKPPRMSGAGWPGPHLPPRMSGAGGPRPHLPPRVRRLCIYLPLNINMIKNFNFIYTNIDIFFKTFLSSVFFPYFL